MRERLQLSGYAWFERGAAHVCAIGWSIGLSDTTARSYLAKIADAYVMRLLQPWHENLGKCQVKAP